MSELKNKFVCGAFKSDMTKVPSASIQDIDLPGNYCLSDCDTIYDQGNRGICVSIVMKEVLDYKNLQSKTKNKTSLDKFYNERANKKLDGMQVREAMDIASREKLLRFFAKINDQDTLQASIYTNGPCIVCLPVYNYDTEFWKGDNLLGGHALVTIGWNKDGFILNNSWGSNYGDNGSAILPYTDWKYIYELWTII